MCSQNTQKFSQTVKIITAFSIFFGNVTKCYCLYKGQNADVKMKPSFGGSFILFVVKKKRTRNWELKIENQIGTSVNRYIPRLIKNVVKMCGQVFSTLTHLH